LLPYDAESAQGNRRSGSRGAVRFLREFLSVSTRRQ
jgi:hypothetical protein